MSPETGSERSASVCLISPSFVPAYGGAELRFRRYLPGLRERGIRACVVTGTPKTKKLRASDRESDWYALPPGAPVPTEPLDGCPVHRVRLPDRTGLPRTRVLFDEALRVCNEVRPDVVQLLGWQPLRNLPWLYRLRRRGARLVFGASVMARPEKGPWRRFAKRMERRLVFGTLDCIVALSEPLRDELRALGVRTRIEVIPNGVDLERFHPPTGPEKRAARKALGVPEDGHLMLCVGSVHPRKGIDLLIEAFARLAPHHPELQVAVAGPRRDLEQKALAGFRSRLETAVVASGASERVHWLGEVDDVAGLLRAADVFVFPSQREGLPNAVLEAMATALPVVLCPFAGLSADLGRDGEQYRQVPHDPGALAQAVKALLENPDEATALGREARAWLVRTMDVRTSLDRYAALYRELAT